MKKVLNLLFLPLVLLIGFTALALLDPAKTVKKKTDKGWIKIIDVNGDGTADMTVQPSGQTSWFHYMVSKPSTKDVAYFAKN